MYIANDRNGEREKFEQHAGSISQELRETGGTDQLSPRSYCPPTTRILQQCRHIEGNATFAVKPYQYSAKTLRIRAPVQRTRDMRGSNGG